MPIKTSKNDKSKQLTNKEFEDIINDFRDGEESGLFFVWRKNPYFPLGSWVYLYNEGFQQVKMVESGRADGGKEVRGSRGKFWKIKPVEGLIIPRLEVMPYVRRMPKGIPQGGEAL